MTYTQPTGSGSPAATPRVTAGASLARARALLDANEYAAALAEYEQLIAAGTDLAAACQGAGYILFLSGQLDRADALLSRSLAVNPANANALYLRDQIAAKRSALGQAPPPGYGDVAGTLGIYEYLTRDESPLSQQTVHLIDQLTMSARPHVIAYAGRRSQHPLPGKLRVLRALLVVLWALALLLQVPSARTAAGGPAGLHTQALAVMVTVTLLVVAIPALLYLVFAWTTRYTLVRGRLQVETGLLSRNIRTVELWRVARMELHRSLLNRITGDGTLVITIRDEQRPLLVTGLKRGRELEAVRQQLMNLVFALRGNPMVKGIIQ